MTGGASVEGTFHAVVTKTQANITVGGGGGWEAVVHQDPGGGRGDPLPFSNLDSNDIFFVYC